MRGKERRGEGGRRRHRQRDKTAPSQAEGRPWAAQCHGAEKSPPGSMRSMPCATQSRYAAKRPHAAAMAQRSHIRFRREECSQLVHETFRERRGACRGKESVTAMKSVVEEP